MASEICVEMQWFEKKVIAISQWTSETENLFFLEIFENLLVKDEKIAKNYQSGFPNHKSKIIVNQVSRVLSGFLPSKMESESTADDWIINRNPVQSLTHELIILFLYIVGKIVIISHHLIILLLTSLDCC